MNVESGANNSKPEPYWQKAYRLLRELSEHFAQIPRGEVEALLSSIGDDFGYLRRCDDGSWIAAFYRDGRPIEVEGRTPEKALEKLYCAKCSGKGWHVKVEGAK